MRVIHNGGFLDTERDSYREVLYSNIVSAMQVVLESLATLGLTLDPSNVDASYVVEDADADTRVEDPTLTNALVALRSDPAVKSVLGAFFRSKP